MISLCVTHEDAPSNLFSSDFL